MKETTKLVVHLRKQGKTYREIQSQTGLSKGNISYICRKHVRSNDALSIRNRRPGSSERMKELGRKAREYYERQKQKAIDDWTERLSFISPLRVSYMSGLYDGEGNHKGTEFRLCNSDKSIIDFVLSFLEELGAKVSTSLSLHATHDREACEEFWGLSFDSIYQTDSREQKRDYSATENYGTVNIRVLKPLGLREALGKFSCKGSALAN